MATDDASRPYQLNYKGIAIVEGKRFGFIVGAQKSGTTSLARALNQHPDVCLGTKKEPDYFSGQFDQGESWYASNFDDKPGDLLLDASTSYASRPLSQKTLDIEPSRELFNNVAERIKGFAPDARIIYIIREPALRSYSHYWHEVKYGREKRPFLTAIEQDPFYLEVSKYYEQILPFYQHFDAEQILIIKFDEFVKDQAKYLNQCIEHLNLKQAELLEPKNSNKGGEYNAIGRFLIHNPLTRNLDKLLPKALVKKISGMMSKKPQPLDEFNRATINGAFIEDDDNFYSLTGVRYLKS